MTNPKKEQVVKEFLQLIEEYPIVGAVNMEALPTKQLQKMREQLRETVVLRMTKRRIMKIAIDKAKKPGIKDLIPYLKGMPALLFTKDNPFKLYKTLQKSKSPAPAKAGQIAPFDIIVPAGPTSFAPGPVIGELGALGIKSGVDGGKIAIKADCVVAKEGAEISAALASMLTRLDINPMEIGLDLVAVCEDGTIFTRDVLHVDETEFMAKLNSAYQWAFNLSVESGYPTSDTIEYMLFTAAQGGRNLAIEANILTSETTEDIVAKAHAQMMSLARESSFEVKEGSPALKEEKQQKTEPRQDPTSGAPHPKEEKEKKRQDPIPELPVEPEPIPEALKEEKKSEQTAEEPQEEKHEEHSDGEPTEEPEIHPAKSASRDIIEKKDEPLVEQPAEPEQLKEEPAPDEHKEEPYSAEPVQSAESKPIEEPEVPEPTSEKVPSHQLQESEDSTITAAALVKDASQSIATPSLDEFKQAEEFLENLKKKDIAKKSQVRMQSGGVSVRPDTSEDTMRKTEEILQQLKRGTLETPVVLPKESISAEDYLNTLKSKDEAEQKRIKAARVPTAHELMEAKRKKNNLTV